LQLTSGRCPAECGWVVAQLLPRLLEEATARGIDARVIETVPGEAPGTLRSALVALDGADIECFLRSWVGTVLWVGRSPFRPHHKRKNWFVGVHRLDPPQRPPWSETQIRIDTLRASGPGGQHVNRTESAVRATHLPTGLSAIAQEERSQHLNRTLALARLARLLAQEEERTRTTHQQARWSHHHRLVRGNAIRTYEGEAFRLAARA
jgi:peptide chain release factor